MKKTLVLFFGVTASVFLINGCGSSSSGTLSCSAYGTPSTTVSTTTTGTQSILLSSASVSIINGSSGPFTITLPDGTSASTSTSTYTSGAINVTETNGVVATPVTVTDTQSNQTAQCTLSISALNSGTGTCIQYDPTSGQCIQYSNTGTGTGICVQYSPTTGQCIQYSNTSTGTGICVQYSPTTGQCIQYAGTSYSTGQCIQYSTTTGQCVQYASTGTGVCIQYSPTTGQCIQYSSTGTTTGTAYSCFASPYSSTYYGQSISCEVYHQQEAVYYTGQPIEFTVVSSTGVTPEVDCWDPGEAWAQSPAYPLYPPLTVYYSSAGGKYVRIYASVGGIPCNGGQPLTDYLFVQ